MEPEKSKKWNFKLNFQLETRGNMFQLNSKMTVLFALIYLVAKIAIYYIRAGP